MTVTATKGTSVPEDYGDLKTVEDFERALEALGVPLSEKSEERDKLLTGLREARFAERKAKYEADTTIDPRRARYYLDRELWDTARCAQELGITTQRISMMRSEVRVIEGREVVNPEWPHPSVFPAPDGPAKPVWRWGVPSYMFEAGRIREWAEKRGHNVLDLDTGKLNKVRVRHGRPRHDRTLLSRVQPKGAPRRGKKSKDTDTSEQ